MARRYVADLQPGQRLDDQVFLIASKDLRTTNQGSLYIHAVLADKTGQLLSRAWQASESMFANMPQGGFLRFKGRTENYKGTLQFIIEAMKPVDPRSVDIGEFLPHTERDVEEMFGQVRKVLANIRDPFVRALVDGFLNDEERMRLFKRSPAAMQLHHAYVGGLLEHTLNVLEIAQTVMPRYPEVSLDLVLAGVFLHDMGKTAELASETAFGYTENGQLLGHIALAAMWIEDHTARVAQALDQPFPERTKWALQHIVLSHHGQYEFGSPKLPATPEAIAVHYLDNLDAKLYMFLSAITKDHDPQSSWTKFNPALGTKVYKPDVLGIRKGTPAPGAP